MISKKEFISNIIVQANRRNHHVPRILSFIVNLTKREKIIAQNEVADFYYLTICKKSAFNMIWHSINSLIEHSKFLPKKIIIVSDGSWSEREGELYFSNFNLDISFDNWEKCALFHRNKGRRSMYNWATKQIWGKKMAVILKYAEECPVLFADPDVLWFNSPFDIDILKTNKILKTSIDNSHNYDEILIDKLNLEYLYELPPVNCGVVLAKGNLFDICSKKIITSIDEEALSPGNFAEQTIFAMMVYEFGETWPEEEITACIDDILSSILIRSKYSTKLIARHYVWYMSWLFWRDLLFRPKKIKLA
jgi:hypothetical protein